MNPVEKERAETDHRIRIAFFDDADVGEVKESVRDFQVE